MAWHVVRFFIVAQVSAGVYRWVDENGRVHFDDRPPVSEAQEVDIREQTPASQSGRDEAAINADRKQKRQLKRRRALHVVPMPGIS
ncbi:DUF4124 domain-containing protein [Solemya velesiana gill symbiont]|uniref:DUF4124 domain-containing protein n=1 Tax=Solemya velesiana gill symbiont TaxID=1918948 RepID=UPI001FE9A431|nr:DUF4124 domain-containing protein [Solemya velesiana gill symbiont]